MIATLSGLLAVSVVALLLPVRGVHRRLRAAKTAELERVRAALRRARDGLLAPGAGTGAPAAPLSDLIAYHGFVQGTSTWPFDVSTLLRFALWVSLGAGSWVGSAFVERVLDATLE